jgi:hypothetical protein
LIVRRQPKAAGDQLAFDDLDGWRLHALITNVAPEAMTAAEVEAHHRLRGGIPEDTIRALKNDFGMIHAPVQAFFGNWLYSQAAALAHNVGLWLRTLALPRAFRRALGKRLRLAFLNVAARLVRHGRPSSPSAASSGLVAFSRAMVVTLGVPRGAAQKDPAPWVGQTAVCPGNEAMSRCRERYWARANSSARSGSTRSVRAAPPTTSDPPVNTPRGRLPSSNK